MSNMGQRTTTEKLIHRLRLMADAGGMLSKDRIRTIIESADRLDELYESVTVLEERIAIMTEPHELGDTTFPGDGTK